ncbi:MAG TPA: twin-arginine translocation signal domain-containing protein [Candidatus Sulfotelmatobacter sp.]|nr:twin-arginine translocation signal domain-containing protein [Candidatus Sulfotelmatobacter sp.]
MTNAAQSPDRRQFLKGVMLGAGSGAVAAGLLHPHAAAAQSIESYVDKVPMATRWDLASTAYLATSVTYFKTRLDQGGKEQFDEFMRANGRQAEARFPAAAARYGFTGTDLKSAVAILPAIVALAFGPQQKFEVAEATADSARVRCLTCAFWNTVQAMKVTDDLCSGWSRYSWEGRAKALNPRLTVTLVKARPLGDPVCEWAFELKA